MNEESGASLPLSPETLEMLRAYLARPRNAGSESAGEVRDPPAELSAYLARAGQPFSRLLLERIRESGESEVAVYKRAGVDRKLFSKIRGDPHRQPKKSTVIAFALALRLSVEETRDLLASAGYAFSDSATFDLIIRFFIERGEYDRFRINDALYAFKQPILAV
ncbi:MAG: hypothetical protein RBT78_11945 [Kiritimatiellia bacterium]|jgi:hypothetical protein|nr:hypothetical protein [Kiritimatiellia bacterium]